MHGVAHSKPPDNSKMHINKDLCAELGSRQPVPKECISPLFLSLPCSDFTPSQRTEDRVADALIKPLHRDRLRMSRERLGMAEPPRQN